MKEVVNLALYKQRETDKHLARLNRALFLILRAAEQGRMGRIDYINSLIQPDCEWLDKHQPGSRYELIHKSVF